MSKEEGETMLIGCPSCLGIGRLGAKNCPRCLGSGEIVLENVREGETLEIGDCLRCGGSGKVRAKSNPIKNTTFCPRCGGAGEMYTKEVHPLDEIKRNS